MCAPLEASQEAEAKLRPLMFLPACVQEELEAFEKRQQRGGRRSKRRGRREELDDHVSGSGSWKGCATVVIVPLGGVLLSVAAYYLMSMQ